ncbi:MAG: ATPase [Bacteroidetes bacterium]|nr:MAG: ATPase [Bacteroidota bacterium]
MSQNFLSGINSVIISPRRWGKSSLVEKTIQTLKNERDLIICKIDLYNVRSEEEFYLKLANTVLKETASKWEEFIAHAKAFLSQLLPQISMGMNDENSLRFGISWKDLQQKPDDILDLAEKIAIKKNIRIVICLDEFQNISTFGDSLALQKKLRAHFQRHQHVSYCLYGSKRHMLMDVFTNTSMPFYKFGNIMFLEKIKTKEWVPFIRKRFSDAGKEISKAQAERIVSLVENHSYYVQQLSQQVWLRTTRKCTDDIVEQAHLSLIQQLSLLFVTLTEGLSNTQVNYLKALLSGEKQLTSKEVLHKYRLGTSANVVRLKRTLVKNDVLDNVGNELTFQDPLYKCWLIQDYFKLKK